ncbi:MAG: hypothetical protein WBD40_22155 [Tepidisphaeraceae bacterium]
MSDSTRIDVSAMDVSSPLILLVLACWAMLLLCVAGGAVVYHWPDVFSIDRRRGFDVLPPRDAAPVRKHPNPVLPDPGGM